MWARAAECAKTFDDWFDGSLRKIDPKTLRPTVKLFMVSAKDLSIAFKRTGDHDAHMTALALKEAAYELDSILPALAVLSNPAMRQRHINEICDILELPKDASARHFTSSLTFRVFMQYGIMLHLKELRLIGHTANREHELEIEFKAMKSEIKASHAAITIYFPLFL